MPDGLITAIELPPTTSVPIPLGDRSHEHVVVSGRGRAS